jgi:hypothetical protein
VVGRAIVRVEPAFAGIDPGITVAANNRAPKLAALATDLTNTGAGAYVDMLTTTVTTEAPASNLILQVSTSFVKQTAGGGALFQIQVNGVVVVDGTYVTVAVNEAGNATLLARAPVTAGTHTILVRWASSPNQLVCRPVTNLNEFASVYIQETL